MNFIKFRRLKRANVEIGKDPKTGKLVSIQRWEIAMNERNLWDKLDGEMAEIIMPAAPWYVRCWRWFFPLRGETCQLTVLSDYAAMIETERKRWEQFDESQRSAINQALTIEYKKCRLEMILRELIPGPALRRSHKSANSSVWNG